MCHQPASHGAHQAHQALGRGPQHHQQQGPEEQQAVFLQAGQHFRQEPDHQRADDGPGHRARAADHHHQHEQQALREAEALRRDEAGERRIQAAGQPRQRGGHGEGHRLERQWLQANGFGRHLAVACGAQGQAPTAARQQRIGRQGHGRGHHGDDGHGPLTAYFAESRAHDAHQPVLPAREAAQLHRTVLHHEAEGDGDHGQVRPLHAQRRQGQQRPQHGRQGRTHGPCRPEGPPLRRGQHRHRVGADRVEAHVAKGHLPAQPDQHIQANAHQRQQRHLSQHESVVAIELRRQRHQHGRDQHAAQPRQHRPPARTRTWRRIERIHGRRHRGHHRHTLRTIARPKSPSGRIASTAITSENVRICV